MLHKRKFFRFVERVKVIDLNNNNKNRCACKKAEAFRFCKTQAQNILKRRSMKTTFLGTGSVCAENDEINEQCLNWFQDATKLCMPISGPLIHQQALKFAKDLNNETFKASNGFLDSSLKT